MNTSSRMMSFGEEQKIHVSKTTGDLLPKDFKVSERGQIEVKGKGAMTTCWVEDRVGRAMPVKDEVSAQGGRVHVSFLDHLFLHSIPGHGQVQGQGRGY